MKGVFLTAGAAGMYCGSCLHDNAIAKSLRKQGVDCLLQPVYTPIRADGESVATDQIFFGGIHIYLLQQLPWTKWIPARIRRALDWPPLIRFATRRAASTDAGKLGELAISMLQGSHGRQSEEVDRLVDWLADEIKPDAIVLSNLLIGGALPEIRRRLPNTRQIVILQGDDIFLDHLPDEHRQQCIALCRELIGSVDHVVTNSRFYSDKMGTLFDVPPEKLVITPLSIDTLPFSEPPADARTEVESSHDEFRLGYLARIAPEKGLHRLVEAFVRLAGDAEHQNLTLHVAGWLGEANHDYLEAQKQTLRDNGLLDRFTYHGSPDLDQKARFLRSLDLLSVPTDYEEPKGLFVLESLASGVPVVQPDHGAFGELIESTGGGVLFHARDSESLATEIENLKRDAGRRKELALAGQSRVLEHHTIDAAAERMRELMFD